MTGAASADVLPVVDVEVAVMVWPNGTEIFIVTLKAAVVIVALPRKTWAWQALPVVSAGVLAKKST